MLRTLLIDNYDSYTFNLYQLLAEVNHGVLPTVLRNDEIEWPALQARLAAGEFHNVVISPGPGTPQRPSDIGISLQLLRAELPVPVLGVCLGFQALALAHGARVAHAPEPVHGRLSAVEHEGHPLFEGIPCGPAYAVVRYHSLIVEETSLPACLQPLAWTCGGHHALQPSASAAVAAAQPNACSCGGAQRLLMGLAHRSLPQYGVQFHPESVATGHGAALLRNFALLTAAHHGLPPPALPPSLASKLAGPPGTAMPARHWEQPGSLRVHHQRLPGVLAAAGGSEALFWHLFGGADGTDSADDTFWLDSATPDRARFSFMGGRGGSLWRRVQYRLPPLAAAAAAEAALQQEQEQQQHAGSNGVGPAAAAAAENGSHGAANGTSGGAAAGPRLGTLTLTAADGTSQQLGTCFLDWLQGLLGSHRCRVSPEEAAALPFNFWGGLVGYLGYELKAECGGRQAHAAPTPDAAFFLADQLVAVDHRTGDVFALSLWKVGDAGSQQEAEEWVAHTAERVQELAAAPPASPKQPPLPLQQQQANGGGGAANGHAQQQLEQQQQQEQQEKQQQQRGKAGGAFWLREGRAQYLQNIKRCMQALHDGESYEVCLTTMLTRQGSSPPAAALYRALRRINPAPYAAWLRFGAGDLQLCCCSPERFLHGGRGGLLEAKPIKGTARRSADAAADAAAAAELAASEKDRAENLMIVDLLRNDLGRVCAPGSVHVPALMAIESYATVHQMVSTVRGLRRPEASVVDCLRAAFPGGSMTGAPKLRTMEIIDGLEGGPRGVYSGSLGYISFNDTFDLNIVIRTAVLHEGRMSIGAGGAIVVQSDPAGEYEEMRLKAAALLRAVGECDGSASPAAVEEG